MADLKQTMAVAIIAATMIMVGIYITDALYSSIPDVTLSVTNETFAAGSNWAYNESGNNSAYIQLANDNIDNSSMVVSNVTTGVAIVRTGNWTLNTTDGTIQLTGAAYRGASGLNGTMNNTNYNATYTHTDTPASAINIMLFLPRAYLLLGIAIIVVAAGAILTYLKVFGQ